MDEGRLNGSGFLISVVQNHAALVELQEVHGAEIYTSALPAEEMLEAARETAAQLGLSITVDD